MCWAVMKMIFSRIVEAFFIRGHESESASVQCMKLVNGKWIFNFYFFLEVMIFQAGKGSVEMKTIQ